MGFLGRMGEKLGLYRTVRIPEDEQPLGMQATEISKKVVSLKDLQAQAPEVSPSVFDRGAGPGTETRPGTQKSLKPRALSYDFGKIYEAAKISVPAHGWTIEKVIKLLKTDQFKEMTPDNIRRLVQGMLAAENVVILDVVKDAIARDKAIDAFELYLRRKVDDRKKETQRKMEEHRREIQALKDSIGDLEKQVETCATGIRQEEIDLKYWVDTAKLAQEEELAHAVSFLTEEPVITTGPVYPVPDAPAPKPPRKEGGKAPPAP